MKNIGKKIGIVYGIILLLCGLLFIFVGTDFCIQDGKLTFQNLSPIIIGCACIMTGSGYLGIGKRYSPILKSKIDNILILMGYMVFIAVLTLDILAGNFALPFMR